MLKKRIHRLWDSKVNRIFAAFWMTMTLALSASTFASDEANVEINNLNQLAQHDSPPEVFDRTENKGGIDSLYFSGEPYQGKSTRIFSYYKAPEGEGPFPAVVLVHGGGGSAYQTWVKKWNEAGFAALAIAVEGQTGTQINKRPPNKWQKHQWAGPSRQGIYEDTNKPLLEQWMYHASSAVIKGHNLLRSFDEINPEQIGLSGISWEGVLTSTVIGFDQRFAFAIPIYGSGFLDSMENQYRKALKNNESYRNIWEPALRIDKFNQPTLWITGLKESHFSLDAQASTYKLLNSHYQSIQPNLKHNHPAAWTVVEAYEFARAIIHDKPLPIFSNQSVKENKVSIEYKYTDKPRKATLYYTQDQGHTFKRWWHTIPVDIKPTGNKLILSTKLPQATTAWLFNIEQNGFIYSSEFSERSVAE
tara:strand:- start:1797 stop:3050 length:1254 start_codon:yes stop_codon:yes gene_type:complete